MAYITADEVREIRNALKAEFPNLRFSVRKDNNSSLDVSITKGDFDLRHVAEVLNKNNPDLRDGWCPDAAADRVEMVMNRGYMQINHHHFESQFESDPDLVEMFSKIISIMKGEKWFNDCDSMTDYFHIKHWLHLEIGRHAKAYEKMAA